jgi:hypothetical protein
MPVIVDDVLLVISLKRQAHNIEFLLNVAHLKVL